MQLERKMGLKSDVKRKKRFNDSIDREGLGLGFMSFLDDIEKKAKLKVKDYTKPDEEYKFNDPEFEVAPSEGELEDMLAKGQGSDSNQEGFSDQESLVDMKQGMEV